MGDTKAPSPHRRVSNEVLLEKLENLATDVLILQKQMETLQQDYYERKAIHKVLLFLVSSVSAIVAWATATFVRL